MYSCDFRDRARQMLSGKWGGTVRLSYCRYLLNLLTLGIGSFWLNPYINASYAAFYRNLRPRKPEDTPVSVKSGVI